MEFQVGDLVYLKLHPYRHKSLARSRNEKLSPRFYGPFEVLARVGSVAHRLRLPNSTAVHPVFHVSQLHKALGATEVAHKFPPQLSDEMVLMVEPMAVLGIRPGVHENCRTRGANSVAGFFYG